MPASNLPGTSPLSPSRPRLFTARTIIPVAFVFLILVLWLARSHAKFDWRSLGPQLRSVSPFLIIAAILLSYFGYWLRAWRWSVLISPLCKTTALQMLPSQLIGFTIVGLFGRFADLGRPYLIARRLKTNVASQLAVYSIERAFDLASAAILFSITLAFAPHNMPHHEAFARAGVVSLAATTFLAVFALALRFAGHHVAALAQRLLHPLSATFARATSARILEFSAGLRIVSTIGEFVYALAISIFMWLCIAATYFCSTHAFQAAPTLANLSLAAIMLLLATSLGGSLLQLPILGWFTQIALLAAALHGFFNVPLETASACGTIILLVSNIAVIPSGLIAARIDGISLRDAASNPSA